MKRQLICESKIKSVDFMFQDQPIQPIPSGNDFGLDYITVINEYINLNSGNMSLSFTDSEYKFLGSSTSKYSFVEIIATFPILITFAVQNQTLILKTAKFSYNNTEQKLLNLKVLNPNSITTPIIPKEILVTYLLLEDFDFNYTTVGAHYV